MIPIGIDQDEADARYVQESLRNQPNGFLGLDASGNAAATVTHRVGTAAEIDAIVLAAGELAFVTDLNELRRGNGATSGGLLSMSLPLVKATVLTQVSTSLLTFFTIPVYAGLYEIELSVNAAALLGGNGTVTTQFSIAGPATSAIDYNPLFDGFNLSGVTERLVNGTITRLYAVEGDQSSISFGLTGAGAGAIRSFIKFGASGNLIARYINHSSFTAIEAYAMLSARRIA